MTSTTSHVPSLDLKEVVSFDSEKYRMVQNLGFSGIFVKAVKKVQQKLKE